METIQKDRKKEQWIKWEPVEGLTGKYYLDDILDTNSEFKLTFSSYNEKSRVDVVFYDSVDAYRRTDGSLRCNTIDYIDQLYGTSFYANWTFFKVDDSAYLQWVSEQSHGISDSRLFIHFSFIAAGDIVDVITNYEPAVAILKPI